MSKKVAFSDVNTEHENEEDSELEFDGEKRQFNKFELLDLIEGDVDGSPGENSNNDTSDDEATADAGGNKQSRHDEKTVSNIKSGGSKRKPRKKRGKKTKRTQNDGLDDELTSLTTAVSSVNLDSKNQSDCLRYKLLKVDTRNLIPEAELKRIFGRGVIKEDKSRPKIHPGSNLQRSRFVSSSYYEAKPTSPFVGPRMELDDTINNVRDHNLETARISKSDTSSTIFTDPDRPVYYKFVHDKPYQEAQRLFMEAVHGGHSDFIVQNLSAFPAHAESLIQLSHMIRVSEDYKTASEFIERALVVFERGFHPRFNIATATCRLSYKRPENRTFFITIFKHISCCHRRGLRRTPFEYSKLLLSLEPENDPLMAVQMLDFFALRCEDYDYLIDFFTKWERLQKLPNLNFSLALAYFFKSRNTRQSRAENETCLQEADRLLKEALLIYPNFIIPLLDACSGEPDAALRQCSYFDYSVYGDRYKLVPETVEVLINLYVKRTYSVWKQKPVLAWLERNVAKMVTDFAGGELKDESKHIQHWSQFPKVVPKNLLRHIVLSDLDIKVPPSASSASYIDIDPYPPSDSIVTYDTRTALSDQTRQNGSAVGGGSLFEDISGLFLRSILPSFSLTEQARERHTNQARSNDMSISLEQPINDPSARTSGNQANSRQIPEGGAVLRISGEGRVQSHFLDRGEAESLISIIDDLREQHGIELEELPDEPTAPSEGDEEAEGRGGNSGDSYQDGLRRRQQPPR